MFERLTLLKQCRNNATVFKQYGEIKYISNTSEILYFVVLALVYYMPMYNISLVVYFLKNDTSC